MESRLADERVGGLQLQVVAVFCASSVVATVVGFWMPRKMRAGLDKIITKQNLLIREDKVGVDPQRS